MSDCPTCGRCDNCGQRQLPKFDQSNVAAAAPSPVVIRLSNNAGAAQPIMGCTHFEIYE